MAFEARNGEVYRDGRLLGDAAALSMLASFVLLGMGPRAGQLATAARAAADQRVARRLAAARAAAGEPA